MGSPSDRTPPPVSRVFLRPTVAGALAFMDAARDDALDARALQTWFDGHVVKHGFMPTPSTVQEPGVGVVSLRELPTGAWAPAFEERLRQIVRAARVRIALAMSGLLVTPVDDRFLTAAIYAGRVDRSSQWRPRLKGTERLSDVVLSLLAADVLAHRDEYDSSLCVCAICGQISLSRTAPNRTRCAQHLSAALDPQVG